MPTPPFHDPLERHPELFLDYSRPSRMWPRWLTFERITSTIAAIAGMIVLAFQLGGWSSLTNRDLSDLSRDLKALESRMKSLEQFNERHDGQHAMLKIELDAMAREIERIRNRLER